MRIEGLGAYRTGSRRWNRARGIARRFIGKPGDFTVDQFVWTTMQEAPGTFEIPSDILTPVRRYYSSTAAHLKEITSKPPIPEGAEKLVEEAAKMRQEVLPLLEANIAELAKKLSHFGIQP